MRKAVILTLLTLWLPLMPIVSLAQEEVTCQSEIVVQPNDWLWTIAAEFYGNPWAYPLIVEATNAKAVYDGSFAVITNPNMIQVGWKLCLPPLERAEVGVTETAETTLTTRIQIGIKTAMDELPLSGTTATESQVFPIRERQLHPESLDALAMQEGAVTGIVRLALARPVSDPLEPEPLGPDTPANWVLIAPLGDEQSVLAWQEIMSEDPAESPTSSLTVIERAIDEVIPFANAATSQESLQALIAARDTWFDPDTGAGLWVDSLLMEETDDQGTISWILHAFAGELDVPAGEDRAFTVCCRWFACGSATGIWARYCRFWGCVGVCVH